MDESNCDKDLPLMANTKDILVKHYIFNIFCNFEQKKFSGCVFLHLQPMCRRKHSTELSTQVCSSFPDSSDHSYAANVSNETAQLGLEQSQDTKDTFVFILDCCDILVRHVEEIVDSSFDSIGSVNCTHTLEGKAELNFTVEKWCMKIWKPGVTCSCHFPKCIKIMYETLQQGQSLLWVPDQDGKPAVYTYGAWINNRSLFPCQEPPVAMATWEATVSVPEPAVVIMSGDERAKHSSSGGVSSYYYFTRMKLPLSTLSLAVGFWDVEDKFSWDRSELAVDIRIWASPSLLQKVVREFCHYIFSCLKAAELCFDAYPFPRIDFLIVPRGFASLGMASPNVIFLSQSLIGGDESMCCRIAHEIAHAWFGLLIGASDWTEEWLSEGFATYMEDFIHTKAAAMTSVEEKEYCEVKAYMRSKTLCAEVKNTEEELHVLRPNRGHVSVGNVDGVEAVILKNGINPEKGFMQVHYIKGYFLLRYLSSIVGQPSFINFLQVYISNFRGQLVDSLEMLQFFVSTFATECQDVITVDKIASDWLHTSKLPKSISYMKLSLSNSIYKTAVQEAEKWKRLNMRYLSSKSRKRKKFEADDFSQISSDALLLLLDILLKREVITPSVMRLISKFYGIEDKNADVRHKWCELVVKHRYYPGYDALRRFLENDLAMGVYLYGELILNGTPSQRELAEHCFRRVSQEMEPNCIITVQQMLKQVVEAESDKNYA